MATYSTPPRPQNQCDPPKKGKAPDFPTTSVYKNLWMEKAVEELPTGPVKKWTAVEEDNSFWAIYYKALT